MVLMEPRSHTLLRLQHRQVPAYLYQTTFFGFATSCPKLQYRPEVTLQSLASAQIQATTRHDAQLEYITCEGTRLLEQPP